MNNQPKVARHPASRLAWGFALAVLAINFVWAYRLTSMVALVDGWAVLNRIMHFQRGEMSWMEYLLRPHGAHLHSIIYAFSWLDFHYAGGAQALTRAISLIATALFGIFFVRLILREGARRQAPNWIIIFGCAAAMGAICSLADREIMLHPFQMVLSVARLTYIVLLYAIIVGMIEERIAVYIVAMLFSLVAVTFHGTGYVFALCVVLAHLVACRRVWMAVASLAPLLSVVLAQNLYTHGNGELSHLGEALNLRSLFTILPGMAAFFASPLTTLEARIGTHALLGIGFVLFAAVLVFTVSAILSILGVRFRSGTGLWQQLRAGRTGPRVDPTTVFLAIIGIFLIGSSVAATLFWVIRTAGGAQSFPPSFYIFTSGRYGAFACLGFVILIVGLLRRPQLQLSAPPSLVKSGAVLVPACLLGMALYASLLELRVYEDDDRINIAAAGILTGLKPTQPEARRVWWDAIDDPNWALELPVTSGFMRTERKGIFNQMPRLGAHGGAFYAGYRINGLVYTPVASDAVSGRCAVKGTIAESSEFSKRGVVLPLANTDGTVVGFAALLRRKPSPDVREVSGFTRCPAEGAGAEPLYLGHDMRASAALAMGSEAVPPRGSGTLPVMPLTDMQGTLSCAIDPNLSGKGPTAVLTLRNESKFGWTLDDGERPIGIGIHLLDSKGTLVYWDKGQRVPASGAVIAPNATVVLRMPIAAIKLTDAGPERGQLTARFTMVQDGHAWFNNISCDTVVRP